MGYYIIGVDKTEDLVDSLGFFPEDAELMDALEIGERFESPWLTPGAIIVIKMKDTRKTRKPEPVL